MRRELGYSDFYCQYRPRQFREDFIRGRSHKVFLDRAIPVCPHDHEVDIVGVSALRDLVAHLIRAQSVGIQFAATR